MGLREEFAEIREKGILAFLKDAFVDDFTNARDAIQLGEAVGREAQRQGIKPSELSEEALYELAEENGVSLGPIGVELAFDLMVRVGHHLEKTDRGPGRDIVLGEDED